MFSEYRPIIHYIAGGTHDTGSTVIKILKFRQSHYGGGNSYI